MSERIRRKAQSSVEDDADADAELDALLETLDPELGDEIFTDRDLFDEEPEAPPPPQERPVVRTGKKPPSAPYVEPPMLRQRRRRSRIVYALALAFGLMLGLSVAYFIEKSRAVGPASTEAPRAQATQPVDAPAMAALAPQRAAPPAPVRVAAPPRASEPIQSAGSVAPAVAPPTAPVTAPSTAHPELAVILLDSGADPRLTLRAINLPGPVTLALTPSSEGVQERANAARRRGRDVLLALPLEGDPGADSGLSALETRFSDEENMRRLAWNLARFEGYEGVIATGGERATRDPALIGLIVEGLAKRGLAFVDAKSTELSLAADIARGGGLATAEVDLRIPPGADAAQSLAALRTAASEAQLSGRAVVLAPVSAPMLDALERWLASDEGAVRFEPIGRAYDNIVDMAPITGG